MDTLADHQIDTRLLLERIRKMLSERRLLLNRKERLAPDVDRLLRLLYARQFFSCLEVSHRGVLAVDHLEVDMLKHVRRRHQLVYGMQRYQGFKQELA